MTAANAKAEVRLEPAAKRVAAAKAAAKRAAAAAAKHEAMVAKHEAAEAKRVLAAKEEGKPEEAMVTERVPQSFIDRVRTDPTPRPRPITEPFFLSRPKLLKGLETLHLNLNHLVDLEQNVLRQANEKGHADVVVKYTDTGVKKLYPLPGY